MGIVQPTPMGKYGKIPIVAHPYIVDSAGYAYGPLAWERAKNLALDPFEQIMWLTPADLTLHGYVRAEVLEAHKREVGGQS